MNLQEICPNCFRTTMENGICVKCGYQMMQDNQGIWLHLYTVLHGRYLVGRVLGRGGFGITYKAYDIETSKICAIKEYLPGFLNLERKDNSIIVNNSNDKIKYKHGEKRFGEEIEILYRIKRYPHIVQILDDFYENNTRYYVMEFIEGINLKQLVKQKKYIFQIKDALEMIEKVGTSLQMIYDNERLIHRDVSPENILVDAQMDYKIIDFGSAKEIKEDGQDAFSVVLKPQFAPLEQYSDSMPQGSYTDVYALAGTFYYIVSGKNLPTAIERMNGTTKYIPLVQMGVSAKISEAIDRALTINYKKRTQTIKQLLQEILVDSDNYLSDEQPKRSISIKKAIKPVKKGKYQKWYLEIVNGKNKGKKWIFEVDEKKKIIGRDANRCHVIIEYEEISRKHFEITFDENKKIFVGKDYSRNGLLVDRNYIHSEQFQIAPGCLIQFPETDCVLIVGISNDK